ncbi:MAG: cytidine deaminase [Planctomycetales bacterium]|nr:cytidine deaminase [Planctomycetales bacterium]
MTKEISTTERDQLIEVARKVAENAYCRYSKFRVGAAVLGTSGVYTGVNVENASYGLTLCAERSALAAAMSAGERNVRAVAVACVDATPSGDLGAFMPCGACRQWLTELAPDARIYIAGLDRSFKLVELLPEPFVLP